MGLSSLPSPSEGVLTVVLVNTALSVSIIKEILRSILRLLGWKQPPTDDPASALHQPDLSAEPTLTDRFRTRFRPVRFGRRRSEGKNHHQSQHAPDCRVCLCRFDPDSVVSRLPCGHTFHRACLETWLDYHHATCPLCRTRMLPEDPDPVWF
ncbi:putative E3 ubiquitin-protein ligase XERICO [Iris pallida]|uniref:E3 ubiquitin-protein ligase XERICO n=1 Tax=Iris pallida TaxID=29817 RepID=A0AAX6I483_IRIPA|nr:putative E3 ubiquitin-protein ligase XERICO [Iris pallida]KAJ6848100.1 putative E3 ubiquitin-protein ligase XERICO [Iris pallida]